MGGRRVAGCRILRFPRPRPASAGVLFAVVLAAGGILAVLRAELALLGSLGHGIQDAEILSRMLEVALRHHPVTAARRIAAELEIFFKKLLRGAADANIGPSLSKTWLRLSGMPPP